MNVGMKWERAGNQNLVIICLTQESFHCTRIICLAQITIRQLEEEPKQEVGPI